MTTACRLLALLLVAAASSASASFIDYERKEINVKVAYFGPGSDGPRQNLEYVLSRTAPETRSELRRVGAEGAQILFFDFLPNALGEIRGFKIRLHLYATNALAAAEDVRVGMLRGADAVIFVADAGDTLNANVASLKQLDAALAKAGLTRSAVELVLQVNRRKAGEPGLGAAALVEALGLKDAPMNEATASEGTGVFDSLKAATKRVLLAMRDAANEPAAQPAQAAHAAAPAGPRAQGRGYSVPVPAGFSPLRHEKVALVWDAGGVVLWADKRIDAEQAFIGSVVITGAASSKNDPAASDEACAVIGREVAAASNVELAKSEVRAAGAGRTCRYALKDTKNLNRLTVGIVRTGPSWWVITCNLDARDAASASACAEVDAGFRFAN